MKKIASIHILVALAISVFGQDINLTFSCTGESSTIDSVTATNMSTNEKVTFPGNGTLILGQSVGIGDRFELKTDLTLYPNPFIERSTISFNQAEQGMVTVRISNLAGQIICQSNQLLDVGMHTFEFIANSPGIYIAHIENKSGSASLKAICLRTNQSESRIIHTDYIDYDGQQAENFKSQSLEYRLGYLEGETIHFECTSGKFTTIITDSPQESKNCEIEFHDCTDPDGRTYKTVMIGDQIWMEENLAYLPAVNPPSIASDTMKYYYVYDYLGYSVDSAKTSPYFSTYGVLYNWVAAIAHCPDGWHLPSDEEWMILESNLGMSTEDLYGDAVWRYSGDVGTKLWVNNGYGDNSSGFNVVPGGYRRTDSTFRDIERGACFWSSTSTSTAAWSRYLYRNSNAVYRFNGYRKLGSSVRCILSQPGIKTIDPTHITESSAVIGGYLIYFKDTQEIDEMGICWSTSENPELYDEHINVEVKLDQFSRNLTGLTPKTRYFTRAYAKMVNGEIIYGNQVKFITTDGSFMDSRDSTIYGYVKIGNQIWMAENLAYLPSVCSPFIASDTDPLYYVQDYFGNNVDSAKANENYDIYGVLYNWPAAVSDDNINGQDICPEGWHLPSDSEWQNLETFLGMAISDAQGTEWRNSGDVGCKLKSSYGWIINFGNHNSAGFNALPGGDRWGEGFGSFGYRIFLWSSSPNGTSEAWRRLIGDNICGVHRRSSYLTFGSSVRCIMNITQ